MHFHDRPCLRERRRELRTHGTSAEAVLWTYLQRRQLHGRRFRRQHSAGPYIVDFYCASERLAVELDGAAHFARAGREYDQARDEYLSAAGIRVIRFENRMVFDDVEAVLDAIAACIAKAAPPDPAPLAPPAHAHSSVRRPPHARGPLLR